MIKELEVRSPWDGALLKKIPFHTEKEIEEALSKAEELTQKNPLPAYVRIEILQKAATLVEKRKEEFARTAASEGGKPLLDSRVELDRAVQGIRCAAETLSQMHGQEIPMGLTKASQNRLAFTIREPIGVVVAVSAFNHPFNLIVHQVIPAVAVGCPVIVKPASSTPLSCLNLVETLYEAGLPEAWCRAVICPSSLAEKLVTDKRVAYFSFVGSEQVGWALRSKLAPGTRCALEHGGVAPVIFEADAEMDSAVPLIAKGGFYHAGQVCVSVQKVFVHESRTEKFVEKLTRVANQLKVGDPLLETTEVGPLISVKEQERVDEWVKEAVQSGAKLAWGGKKLSNQCYAPTVLLNPSEKVRVSMHEVFGPVISVYTYRSREEAIQRANALPYAFQASLFTKNLDVALDTVKKLHASTVMVNDHTAFRVDWMPFGGRKNSGLGVGGIPYSMHEMTQEKLVVFKSSVL